MTSHNEFLEAVICRPENDSYGILFYFLFAGKDNEVLNYPTNHVLYSTIRIWDGSVEDWKVT